MNRRAGDAVLAVALVACACGPSERASVPGDDGAREGGGSAADSARHDGAVCLEGGPFVADGPMDVSAPGTGTVGVAGTPEAAPDADRVAALRWQAHEGCERFVVDLVDPDGNPADRTGDVTAELMREPGVVRIGLRDVEWVEPHATDADFEGPLARAAYAVFSAEGRWVYVDVHLGDPAEARVTTLTGPARVVVDLRPGGGPVPGTAPADDRIVVLKPRPGTASYPLTVTGYARTFEANVVVRLEHDGDDVHEDFTTATSWADAWGHYAFTIPDGPSGPVTLHVGEHSARDGTWQGVAVPLEMR